MTPRNACGLLAFHAIFSLLERIPREIQQVINRNVTTQPRSHWPRQPPVLADMPLASLALSDVQGPALRQNLASLVSKTAAEVFTEEPCSIRI